VIAGAFVDPSAADVPGADSAAERAARLRPKLPDPEPPIAHRRPRPWRRPMLFAFGLLVLLVAALGGTYAWTQTQYFVGPADADVAIYRGINTEFGPLKFFTVYKVTSVRITQLSPSVRSQVRAGITADSERAAEKIVGNLRSLILASCPPAPGTESATASETTIASGSSTSRRPTTPTPTKATPKVTPTVRARTSTTTAPLRRTTGTARSATTARRITTTARTSPLRTGAATSAAARSTPRVVAPSLSESTTAPASATSGAPCRSGS
jgi:protein phosphatase